MAAGSVTLLFDGSFAAAHALIDRCCDARWLAASRRAKLRAQAALEPEARQLLHDRLSGIEELPRDAAEGRARARRSVTGGLARPGPEGREPSQRRGAALRVTIPNDRAEAAVVRDLAGWG